MTVEQIGDATLYTGDVLEVLRSMASESVHCIVTSPPYWGLRDYGIEPSVWDGEPRCAHEWADEAVDVERGTGGNWTQAENGDGLRAGKHQTRFKGDLVAARKSERATIPCRLCGAWRGAHGLEPTPELYVAHEVTIWREARRVLRSDGTAWVNLGSSYAGGGRGGLEGAGHGSLEEGRYEDGQQIGQPTGKLLNFKPKDMVPIPWMVAMALQKDGWYLRMDIIWNKKNPMPESVTDRPTKSHEYIFLLSKSPRYFYDAEAVREAGSENTHTRGTKIFEKPESFKMAEPGSGTKNNSSFQSYMHDLPPGSGRNRRSVWTVATAPYKEAHFATFPPDLIKPCILAGCPEHVCPKCGAPWVREVETEFVKLANRKPSRKAVQDGADMADINSHNAMGYNRTRTIGEHPTCACGLPAIGGTVLDPFGGSGTTAAVALEYGRRAILIERKPEYMELARRRVRPVAGRPLLDFVSPRDDPDPDLRREWDEFIRSGGIHGQ